MDIDIDIDYNSFSRYVKLYDILGDEIEINALYNFLISIKGNVESSKELIGYDETHYIYKYDGVIVVEYKVNSWGKIFDYDIPESFYDIFIKYYEIEYGKYIHSINIDLFIYKYVTYYLGIEYFKNKLFML